MLAPSGEAAPQTFGSHAPPSLHHATTKTKKMDRNNRRDDRNGRRDEPRGQKPRYGTSAPTTNTDKHPSNMAKPQTANDPAHHHHTTNAATTDDDLALRLEVLAMPHHNDMTAPTTGPHPATHATAPRAHQNPVALVVAARLATHTQTVPIFEQTSRQLPSLKRSHATYRWAAVTKMRTQRPRWLA